MYNLKKVFGIISFETGIIKVLVLDATNKDQPKYLFYDKLDLEYSHDFSDIVNTKNVEEAVNTLTQRADEFLGLTIQSYIINIPALNVSITKQISPKFSVVGGYCSDELKYDLIDKIQLLNHDEENEYIANDIVSWDIDGKKFNTYPLAIPGKEIKYEYITYTCKKCIIKVIKNILANSKIADIAFVCDENISSHVFNDVYVNINKNQVAIYFNHEKKVIDLSYTDIVEKINKEFGSNIPDIKWINQSLNLSKNAPIVNIYNGSYLSFAPVLTKNLNVRVKKYLEEFFDLLASKINEFVGFNNIIINGDDNFIELVAKNKLDNKFIIANSNSIYLSNQNISSMLYAYNYVNNKLISCCKTIVYSVDSFIDEELISKESNSTIFMKIGIASTRWAAKLG